MEIQRRRFLNQSLLILFILLVCRLLATIWIPLNDVSEARYAEIARKMLETNNWVTLWADYGVPFWAKPPLSTWMSAGSMKYLGVNELGARLPALLLSIGILWLVWDLAKRRRDVLFANTVVLMLASTFYFFLDAGTVMTDPALLFCTTLSLVAFWHAVAENRRVWSYVFFVGLGLGLLAKGPVALVLVALPLFVWLCVYRRFWHVWQRLPWFSGLAIMLLIAVPWYWLAEQRTPGFLNYFLVGEHFHRFLTPGWAGDKYGFAHRAPWGMIWFFAAIGLMPWTLLGGYWLIRYRSRLAAVLAGCDEWLAYVFLCTVVPLGFFTFSSNIIYTYVFPVAPFFALFFAEFWLRAGVLYQAKRLLLCCALFCGGLFIVGVLFFQLKPNWVSKTQKPVIAAWQKNAPSPEAPLLYWGKHIQFSAQFYAKGQVQFTDDKVKLCQLLKSGSHYVVMPVAVKGQLPEGISSQFIEVDRLIADSIPLILLHSEGLICPY